MFIQMMEILAYEKIVKRFRWNLWCSIEIEVLNKKIVVASSSSSSSLINYNDYRFSWLAPIPWMVLLENKCIMKIDKNYGNCVNVKIIEFDKNQLN